MYFFSLFLLAFIEHFMKPNSFGGRMSSIIKHCIVIAGKKGFKGIERSGKASSSCSRSTSEEAGCSDIEMHAGSGSCSSSSQSSSCANVHRGTGCTNDAQ